MNLVTCCDSQSATPTLFVGKNTVFTFALRFAIHTFTRQFDRCFPHGIGNQSEPSVRTMEAR